MTWERTSANAQAGDRPSTVTRYAPDMPLPPYTYVAGRTPHPIRDPRGHLHGRTLDVPPPLDPRGWQESSAYRYGIDLFNFGYYWEAHEVWEGLWHSAQRTGPVADFLKGLIKLAAAGVKAYEGRPDGVRRHAARARALFESAGRAKTSPLPLGEGSGVRVSADPQSLSACPLPEGEGSKNWFGLTLMDLIGLSQCLQTTPPRSTTSDPPVAGLLGTLTPAT